MVRARPVWTRRDDRLFAHARSSTLSADSRREPLPCVAVSALCSRHVCNSYWIFKKRVLWTTRTSTSPKRGDWCGLSPDPAAKRHPNATSPRGRSRGFFGSPRTAEAGSGPCLPVLPSHGPRHRSDVPRGLRVHVRSRGRGCDGRESGEWGSSTARDIHGDRDPKIAVSRDARDPRGSLTHAERRIRFRASPRAVSRRSCDPRCRRAARAGQRRRLSPRGLADSDIVPRRCAATAPRMTRERRPRARPASDARKQPCCGFPPHSRSVSRID